MAAPLPDSDGDSSGADSEEADEVMCALEVADDSDEAALVALARRLKRARRS